MGWQDKPEVKKGNLGESLVDNWLLSRNVIPYSPQADVPHPFDRLCASSDKRTLCVVEVKTKARRTHYPDTGFELSHYHDYKHIQEKYSVPVFVAFVDESAGCIYGNFISQLELPTKINHPSRGAISYPLHQKTRSGSDLILFPLKNMRQIAEISATSREVLIGMSNRNYEYSTEGFME